MIQSSRIPLAHGITLRQLYIIVQISDQQNVQGNTCELNQYGKLDVDWFHYFIANCYTVILSVHSEKKFSTADCYMKISLVMERPAYDIMDLILRQKFFP